MKQLFFLLAFLNIVYFFWGQTATEKTLTLDDNVPLYQESQLEKLELISKDELSKRVTRQPLMESKPEKSTLTVATECYRVGDFATEDDANELLNTLSGLNGLMQVVPFIVSNEFWVVYPFNGDWGQSLQNLEQLKAKGVTDLWLVPKGDYKGVISLGLFIKPDRADNRLRELAEKQVEAEIIKREKSRYGVKVEINGGEAVIQHYLDNLETDQKHSLRKISC